MSRTCSRALGVTLAAAFLSACRPAMVARAPAVRAAVPLQGGGIQVRDATAALAALDRVEHETQTLTALFRVVVEQPDGRRETSQGALAVEQPGRFRVQIFSLGTLTVYDYTVDGDRYRIRLPLQGKQTIGRFGTSEANGGDAPRYDLRPLFLRREGLASARVRDDGDFFRITLGGGTGRREVELSKRNGWIDRETIGAADEPRLRVRYDHYEAVDGVALPYRIGVEYPAERRALEIEIVRYTRNQPVDEKIFEF